MCGNGLPEYGTIDLLAYEYDETTPNQKNRLLKVIDGSSSPKGFDPGITPAGEYTYDSNGNLTFDPHKGLTITYNHLNLPATILKGGDKIEIYYDATGRKLKQEVVSTEGGHVLEYMNGIDYRNQELNGIYHAEGRVTTGEGGWQYEYFLKDHLGNVRLSVSDLNGNGCIDPTAEPAEILQENHYYPFGLNMDGPWAAQYQEDENGETLLDEEGNPVVDQDKLNRYQYNGKELTEDLGLNWNDYGARWYNSAIGRWNAVDPSAEKYYSMSQFSYAANNPLLYIDPTGAEIEYAGNQTTYTGIDATLAFIELKRQFGGESSNSDTESTSSSRSENDNQWFDLGENGSVVITSAPKISWPGRKYRYKNSTHLSIEVRYYPEENSDPFNFVQSVHTNFNNDDMKAALKGAGVVLGDYWSADGYNDEGTYYTSGEMKYRRREDENGIYYKFDDYPGRVFVKGKTVFWNAELSVVENAEGINTALITFSFGVKLKGGRPRLIGIERVNQPSRQHQKHIRDAIIK